MANSLIAFAMALALSGALTLLISAAGALIREMRTGAPWRLLALAHRCRASAPSLAVIEQAPLSRRR
jgi:hypothetical protein